MAVTRRGSRGVGGQPLLQSTHPRRNVSTVLDQIVQSQDDEPEDATSRITGAAGGIGHLAEQIARTRGAYVIGAARAVNHPLLAELGTDETINYTPQELGDVTHDVDVVLDLAGGQTPLRAVPTLRDGGLLIAATSGRDLASQAAGDRVHVTYILVEPDRAGLEPSPSSPTAASYACTSPRPSTWRKPHARTNSARPGRRKASSWSQSTKTPTRLLHRGVLR
jgi:Zinc-binding dehydrogenase